MHPHGPFVVPPAAEQVAQGKVQLGRVGIVLHRFNEGVNRLVLLLIEQEVQPSEIGLGGLPVLDAKLPQVQPGGQPAERESDGETQ